MDPAGERTCVRVAGSTQYRGKQGLEYGDFLYIPANTPHLPYNASDSQPCVGLVARTDPNEQESVTLLPLSDPGVAPAR